MITYAHFLQTLIHGHLHGPCAKTSLEKESPISKLSIAEHTVAISPINGLPQMQWKSPLRTHTLSLCLTSLYTGQVKAVMTHTSQLSSLHLGTAPLCLPLWSGLHISSGE